MPFLRLNGWDVPIIGAERAQDEIGERGTALDGSVLIDRRALKSRWRMTTRHVSELVAEALEGVLRGSGQSWSFDADLYSSKGLGPGATVGSQRLGIAADGSTVVDASNVAESKYGTYSLTVEPAATNILAANKRNGTEDGTTTGFAAVAGGAIASSTTQKMRGSRSLRVITSASGDGAETTTEIASAATAYAGQLGVWTAADRSVKVQLIDSVGTVVDTTFTARGGKWTRLTVTGTTAGGATTIKIRFLDNAAGGATFYLDEFQIETGSVATTWADPSRGAGNLTYGAGAVQQARDLTVAFWAKMPTANTGAQRALVSMRQQSPLKNVFNVNRSASSNNLVFHTFDSDAVQDALIYSSSPWNGAWHHVACVLRHQPETGETAKTIYFDGTSVATTATHGRVDFSAVDGFWLGSDVAGGTRLGAVDGGLIDDVLVVPYAAPLSLVAAWFNLGKGIAGLPSFYADGDFDAGIPLTLQAIAGPDIRSQYVRAQDGSIWRPNQRRLTFDLLEK